MAGVLFDKLLVHGMQPNLKPSKSEVFVDLRGEGSVECRRQIHEDDYRLHTTSEYLTEPLRIVGSCKHLGTWIQTNGKVVKELRSRIGAAHQTITKYEGAIFWESRHDPIQEGTAIRYLGHECSPLQLPDLGDHREARCAKIALRNHGAVSKGDYGSPGATHPEMVR